MSIELRQVPNTSETVTIPMAWVWSMFSYNSQIKDGVIKLDRELKMSPFSNTSTDARLLVMGLLEDQDRKLRAILPHPERGD